MPRATDPAVAGVYRVRLRGCTHLSFGANFATASASPLTSKPPPPPALCLSLQVHDKVNAAWADGSVHAAEIVDERVRRGCAEKSTRPEDKEYYVHYIDCA